MSISRSSKGEYDFQQIQLEHVQKTFFSWDFEREMSFSYYFGDLKSSSRSNVLAYKLEIGARILPCVRFYLDCII